jgi:hypothetical protein
MPLSSSNNDNVPGGFTSGLLGTSHLRFSLGFFVVDLVKADEVGAFVVDYFRRVALFLSLDRSARDSLPHEPYFDHVTRHPRVPSRIAGEFEGWLGKEDE